MWLNYRAFCAQRLSKNCLEYVQRRWGRRRPRVMGVGPQPLAGKASGNPVLALMSMSV